MPTPKLTPLASLKPWPRNPRRIRPERLEQLKRSLTADPAMMDARPLVALPDGTVIMGNQRLAAARSLGWKKIQTLTVDLDDATAQSWALRDNQGYGEWDDDAVGVMLAEMRAAGADLDLAGFEERETQRLLDAITSIPPGVDDAPALPKGKPRSKPGEVYELGPHRLLCGDALEMRAACGVEPVACLLTDPPYGIALDTDYRSMSGAKTKRGTQILGVNTSKAYRPVIGDGEPFNGAPIAELYADCSEQFWFGANYYRRTLSASDLDGSWLVWDKRGEGSDDGYGSGFELVWSRRKHQQRVLRHFFFGAFGADGANRQHPTQKPVPMLMEILERWTKAGDVVADPYGGSGSVLMACARSGRVCVMSEIDPAYCDVIRARYEALA